MISIARMADSSIVAHINCNYASAEFQDWIWRYLYSMCVLFIASFALIVQSLATHAIKLSTCFVSHIVPIVYCSKTKANGKQWCVQWYNYCSSMEDWIDHKLYLILAFPTAVNSRTNARVFCASAFKVRSSLCVTNIELQGSSKLPDVVAHVWEVICGTRFWFETLICQRNFDLSNL